MAKHFFLFFIIITNLYSSEKESLHVELSQHRGDALPISHDDIEEEYKKSSRKKIVITEEQKRKLKEYALRERQEPIKQLLRPKDYSPRRRPIVFSKLDIQSNDMIHGIETYTAQNNSHVSVGRLGELRDDKFSLEICEENPIIKIIFGANTEEGFISGFGFSFKDGHFVSFGSFLDPKHESPLEENEKILGIFGHYKECIIQTLGFTTTRKEYGPFGKSTKEAEDFSIITILGKI